MLKIRRIHIVNAGYDEATFDGETFDFRASENGEPSHCVLHAENGTGKTTALGLIFNIAVPKEARFLPHLVKSDYEFADYFSRGMGVVAVEWHDPAGRHPVTVHFVMPQLKAGERQTWRRWLLFRSGMGFTFDDLPLKGLAGRGRTSFVGRDDVMQWLRDGDARFADSHDFEVAATQDVWRRMIERHGIDTFLMDSQLEFNRQEGGLDAFLRIAREEEFVARFLSLCLVAPDHGSEAMAEPVCIQVRTIVARMQGYDKLVAKRGLLADLVQAFGPFVEVAQAWRTCRQDVALAETRAAAIKQAAMARADALQVQAEQAHQAAQSHAGQLEEWKTEKHQAEIDTEAGGLALVEQQEAAAVTQRTASIEAANLAENSRARLAAARDLRDILAVEAEIAGFQRSLAEVEKEAAEPHRLVHAAGARLEAMLLHASSDQRDAVEREEVTASEADFERAQAIARRDSLANEQVAMHRRDANLETKIAAAEVALAELRADDAVGATEPVAVALVRLARASDEAMSAVRDAASRASRHGTTAEAAMQISGDAEAERREALSKAEAERGAADRAEQSRDALVGQDAWRELGAVVSFGPEAAVEAESRARSKLDESRREHARADLMRQDVDRIARHHVAAVDRNVDFVLTRLADLGFRSGIAAAAWLADVVDDPIRLRAFAAADPAAFAGVFVQEADERKRLLEVDLSGLPLDRPVAILAPSESPIAGMDAVCAVPDRSEAYDMAAADALVDDLGAKVGEAEVAAQAAQAGAHALTALQTAIESWIAEWGSGRLEASRRRVADLEAAAKLAASRAAAERRRAEDERSAADRAQADLQQQTERRTVAEQARMQVARWQRQHGDHLAEWRRQRGGLVGQLTTIVEKMAHEQALADSAQQRAEHARAAKRERERALAELSFEATRIEFRDGDPSGEACTLDEARTAYRTAAEIFQRVLENRLGPLQGKLEAKRQELDRHNDRWRREHGRLLEERKALADVAGDMALDDRLEAARSEERRASEAVGRAKAEADRLQAEARSRRSQFARNGDAGTTAHVALQGLSRIELEQHLEVAQGRRGTAMVEIERLEIAISEADERARRCEGEAVRLRDKAQVLPDAPAPIAALPESLTSALKEIDSSHERLTEAVAEGQRRGRHLVEVYDGFRRDVRSHRDRTLEAVLVDTLTANEPEPAGEDAERLQQLLVDRIATIEQEIEEYESDKNRAVGEMDGVLLSAIGLFQRAVSRGVVPDQVPRFGGKRILAMTFRPPSAESDAGVALRRSVCQQMLIDYVAANEVPQTDHAMAAALLERYARTAQMKGPDEPALGLRLLKSNDHGRIHHLPVAAFKASAGETLTSAMLLYLLVARLRSEGRTSQRTRIGGVLILDNPLGKASNTLFLRMQVALAEAMDVQLIFTTAVKDWAAIGEFPQVVKLRKEATDPATGRIFVKATHQWIGPAEQSLSAAYPPIDKAAE